MGIARLIFKYAIAKVGMAAFTGIVVAWKVSQREDVKEYPLRSQKWAAIAGSFVGELSRTLSPKGGLSRSLYYIDWIKSRLKSPR